MEASAQGLLAIGGDVVSEADPRWFCSACGHTWGRLDDAGANAHNAAINRILRKVSNGLAAPPCVACGSFAVESFTQVMLEANRPASYWLVAHPEPHWWRCSECGHEWATVIAVT
jgi:rubrerythrin